jgi:hypothetical protein
MPDLRFEVIAVLVILLPGFLAARIEQHLVVNPNQNEFDETVEALLYSLFVYIAFTAIFRSLPISVTTEKIGDITRYSISAEPYRLAVLPGLAIVFAAIASFAANNDLWGWLFRFLRVTRRTWRASLWSDVFHRYGGVVQVELADGRSVIGWLRYYSDRPEDRSVFLENAAWVGDNQQTIPIAGPGIFLTQYSGIVSISFLQWGVGDSSESQTTTP